MLGCYLCQSLGASPNDHNEERLESLLDHAVIHKSQINRFAETNVFKIFSDCFPKIAANYTVREIVHSMETSQNSGSSGGTEGKTASIRPKRIKKVPQRQVTILVKNTRNRSQINKERKPDGGQPSKIPIHTLCKKILQAASCDKDQRRSQCSMCNDQVVLRDSRWNLINPRGAIGHVLTHHTDIKPFRCRYCDYAAKHITTMGYHVKVAHQVIDCRSPAHVINETNAHQKKICEMVAMCFGKEKWKVSKKYATHGGKRNHSLYGPSITVHCRQIMASYSKDQRRFECGICSELIALRSGRKAAPHGSLVVQHALSHMDIKPYRCRICAAAVKTQCSVAHHVKKVHKLAASSSIHYINEIAVHKKELCEMITSCFGRIK